MKKLEMSFFAFLAVTVAIATAQDLCTGFATTPNDGQVQGATTLSGRTILPGQNQLFYYSRTVDGPFTVLLRSSGGLRMYIADASRIQRPTPTLNQFSSPDYQYISYSPGFINPTCFAIAVYADAATPGSAQTPIPFDLVFSTETAASACSLYSAAVQELTGDARLTSQSLSANQQLFYVYSLPAGSSLSIQVDDRTKVFLTDPATVNNAPDRQRVRDWFPLAESRTRLAVPSANVNRCFGIRVDNWNKVNIVFNLVFDATVSPVVQLGDFTNDYCRDIRALMPDSIILNGPRDIPNEFVSFPGRNHYFYNNVAGIPFAILSTNDQLEARISNSNRTPWLTYFEVAGFSFDGFVGEDQAVPGCYALSIASEPNFLVANAPASTAYDFRFSAIAPGQGDACGFYSFFGVLTGDASVDAADRIAGSEYFFYRLPAGEELSAFVSSSGFTNIVLQTPPTGELRRPYVGNWNSATTVGRSEEFPWVLLAADSSQERCIGILVAGQDSFTLAADSTSASELAMNPCAPYRVIHDGTREFNGNVALTAQRIMSNERTTLYYRASEETSFQVVLRTQGMSLFVSEASVNPFPTARSSEFRSASIVEVLNLARDSCYAVSVIATPLDDSDIPEEDGPQELSFDLEFASFIGNQPPISAPSPGDGGSSTGPTSSPTSNPEGEADSSSSSSSSRRTTLIGIIVGVSGGVLLLTAVAVVVVRKRSKRLSNLGLSSPLNGDFRL